MTPLSQIQAKDKISGGHCGLYLNDIEGDFKEVKKELNRLLKEKKIVIREGIHGDLIMLRK